MKAKIFTNYFNRIIAATKGFVSKNDSRKLQRTNKDDVKMVLPVRINGK